MSKISKISKKIIKKIIFSSALVVLGSGCSSGSVEKKIAVK